MENNSVKKPIKLVETIFDTFYLSTVLISAILLLSSKDASNIRWQFGIMALLLGIGDSFHLVPRILSLWNSKGNDFTTLLGIGKLITSITMTLFYVVLWEIGVSYSAGTIPIYFSVIVYLLAALRIILCLFPQNEWTKNDPSLNWGILRNIPFFLLGMVVMMLYTTDSFTKSSGLSYLWLAILISYAFYLPVVLFVHKNKKLGMLMLPKSCAYVTIVLMGFSL